MSSREEQRGLHVEPVFFVSSQLPANDQKNYTTSEICAAAEKVCGYESMYGAQRIGGLWRLYPTQRDHRDTILVQGIFLRGVRVTARDKNPYLATTRDGEVKEKPTTKVIVGNVPLSFDDDEIIKALQSIGCEIRSQLFEERDRDDRGKLTRWKTGRRFVYITVPDKPLSRQLSIGPFKASIYHREQKQTTADVTCSKCFRKGQSFSGCPHPIKCRHCFKDGHKPGDKECSLIPEMPAENVADYKKGDGRMPEPVRPIAPNRNSSPAATHHRGRSRVRKHHDGAVSEAARREGSSAKRPRPASRDGPADFEDDPTIK